MPDEFQGLVDELLGGAEPETPPTDPGETQGDEGYEETSEEPDTESVDDVTDEEGDAPEEQNEEVEQPNPEALVQETQAEKDSRAFAEMRVKNAKYEKALARAAKASGTTVDEFLQQIEEKSLQTQAKQMNTDPEILRRMEALEAENEQYRTGQVQMYLSKEFSKVQKELKISDQELQTFTADLINRGHNFQDTSVDYTLLYRGLNHEQLVEKERQAWIARSNKSDSSSTTVTKKGKGDHQPGAVNTPEDLDNLLSGFEE